MADKELYTIKSLAQELGAPESTVRHWRDQYENFLPSVGEGKRKRYRKTAIDVLRFIQERLNRNEPQEEIKEALSREFPQNIDTVADQNRNIATTPPTATEPALVNELLERVQGLLSTQDQRMAALEAENRELRERLVRLEEREQAAIPQRESAPDQTRQKVIAYIIQLRKEGYSYRGIAIRLTEEGIQGLRGGRWDGKTVSRLLKKEGIQ